ncbi:hypothetical protein PMAYCL1PPCAC_23615, partial [Pristionchus mayeri]
AFEDMDGEATSAIKNLEKNLGEDEKRRQVEEFTRNRKTKRKKVQRASQVFTSEEEVIQSMDNPAVLDQVFSIVFDPLFVKWDERSGVRETILTEQGLTGH